MPMTPEERRARFNERYPTRYKAKAKARHDARMAAMTPEELAEYRARQAATSQRYRDKNQATIATQRNTPEAKQYAANYFQRNKPRLRRYANAHRARNREHINAKARENYAKNLERHKARIASRLLAMTPEEKALYLIKKNVLWHRYNARKKNAPINNLTPEQEQLVIEVAQGRCVYCPAYKPGCVLCLRGAHEDLTVDHILALGNNGNNTLHNLVAACHSCNSRKQLKPNPVPVQPLLL